MVKTKSPTPGSLHTEPEKMDECPPPLKTCSPVSHVFHSKRPTFRLLQYLPLLSEGHPPLLLCVCYLSPSPICCRMLGEASPSPILLDPLRLESQNLKTNKSYFLQKDSGFLISTRWKEMTTDLPVN